MISKKPVDIYLGDNTYLKATKIGNDLNSFDVSGIHNKVKTSDVFYAKDMNMCFVFIY